MKYIVSLLIIFLPFISLQSSDNLKGENINISILRGDKLFNENTPFIININTPDTETKKSNVDLICVIDVSGSMRGTKINHVKESLKTLISLMDENDRMALVIFNSDSKLLLELNYLTKDNKESYITTINSIQARGGTNILSGLEKAVEEIKKITNDDISKAFQDDFKKGEEIFKERTPSIILLSDGNDNNRNEIEIADGLKELTKNGEYYFTLHTFGYGNDHDPKIMTKLANIRDGSFYFVSELSKVKEYFVNVLGGCMSVISKKVELQIEPQKSNIMIKKVFGQDDLYNYDFKDNFFRTSMLQLISGKEYTYVIEIYIPKEIKNEDELFKVTFKYNDIVTNKAKEIIQIYKYETDLNSKENIKKKDDANEEYIRAKTFDVLNESIKLRENKKKDEAKKNLNNMKSWLNSNYTGKGNYVENIDKSLKLISDDTLYESTGRSFVMSDAREGTMKRGGSNLSFSNKMQSKMMSMVK